MGLPRQAYWSGLLFPTPRNFPNPEVEFVSPTLAGGFFTTEPPEEQSLLKEFVILWQEGLFLYFLSTVSLLNSIRLAI